MAPELFTTMEANELREIAARIREWQNSRKISDAKLCKKLSGLGSTKTFKRILDNDLAELDLERQLDNYRAAWNYIESIGDEENAPEERYEDMFGIVQLRRVFTATAKETGLARAIFLIGPSGAGKTEAQQWLIDKYGDRMLTIRANVAWSDRPSAMLGAILDRLGVRDHPISQNEKLVRVIAKLNESRKCLMIEDSHHMGPTCLALVITLVDETPGEFILACIDTLWRKLETHAYEECRQLTGNRLAERINLGREVQESDVRKMVDRRCQWAEENKGVVRLLCEKANNYGRLAFVRETIKRANEKADREPMTVEMFSAAITEEVASR